MKYITEFFRRIPAWLIISAAAAGMMLAGGLRGEISTLFAKAIRVCLECIGIG